MPMEIDRLSFLSDELMAWRWLFVIFIYISFSVIVLVTTSKKVAYYG